MLLTKMLFQVIQAWKKTVANSNKRQLNILANCKMIIFPFWEWERYIDIKSQATNINGILKATKEQKIYILKKTTIYF